MSGYLDWLPDVLRDAGLNVVVLGGAETRSTWSTGGMPDVPPGVIWHHTATGPNWLDGHVAALLRDGHRTLRGPLSQTGVERDGTWIIVALGRCNHDGYGRWENNSIGVEVYNSGTGEPYPAVQLESTQRGIAAILNHLDHGSARCLGHKESASHKIDPLLDMRAMRARIAYYQTAAPTEDDMPLTDDDVDRIARRTQQLLLVEDTAWIDWRLEALYDRIRTHGTTMRNSLRDLTRRALGIEIVTDSAKQHQLDQDTGAKIQASIADPQD